MFIINRWSWVEEWYGLTMEDIREIEKQTQLALQRKMANGGVEIEDEGNTINNLNTLEIYNLDE